MYIILSDSY